LHKDVGLAVGLAREVGVPMRLANMAYEELTEAMNRGWGTRNSTVGQLLQVERAGIEPLAADPKRIAAILEADKEDYAAGLCERPSGNVYSRREQSGGREEDGSGRGDASQRVSISSN